MGVGVGGAGGSAATAAWREGRGCHAAQSGPGAERAGSDLHQRPPQRRYTSGRVDLVRGRSDRLTTDVRVNRTASHGKLKGPIVSQVR